MPIIEVNMLEGMTDEAKQKVTEALTDALVASTNSSRESCIILFRDVPLANYGNAGLTAATRVKQGKPPTTN